MAAETDVIVFWEEWVYTGSSSYTTKNKTVIINLTEVVNFVSGIKIAHDHETKTAIQINPTTGATIGPATYDERSMYITWSYEYHDFYDHDDNKDYGFIRSNNFNEY